MSLINDALKRVSQKASPAAPAPTIGLKPVEEGGTSKAGPAKLLLAVLAAVVLGAGGWFTWKALRPAKPKPPTGAQPAKKTGAVEIAKGAAAQGTGAVAKVTGAVQSNLTSVARANPPGSATGAPPAQLAGGPGTNAEPAVAATGNPPVPALWPKLDLQGIFFRLQNPSARINGTNLYVGNEIEGARVVDIQRLSVLVQLGAETNVLTLGQ